MGTTYSWGDSGDRDPRLGNVPAAEAQPPAPAPEPEPIDSGLPLNAPSMCMTQVLLAAVLFRVAATQLRYETDKRTVLDMADHCMRMCSDVLMNCAIGSVRIHLQLDSIPIRPGIPGPRRLQLARDLLDGAIADVMFGDEHGRAVLNPLVERRAMTEALIEEVRELEEEEIIWDAVSTFTQ